MHRKFTHYFWKIFRCKLTLLDYLIINQPKENYKSYSPIIPNSQIIIRHIEEYTQTSDEKTSNESDKKENSETLTKEIKWYLDLIVKPTSNLPVIITIVIFIMICMCVAIIYLHMKEVKEDSVENQDVFMAWFDSR